MTATVILCGIYNDAVSSYVKILGALKFEKMLQYFYYISSCKKNCQHERIY